MYRLQRVHDFQIPQISAVLQSEFQTEDKNLEERLLYQIRAFPHGNKAVIIDEKLAGFVISYPCDYYSILQPKEKPFFENMPTYFLADLYVAKEHRGNKMGRQFLQYVEKLSRLEGFSDVCIISVNNSSGYWENYGFEEIVGNDSAKFMRKVLL
jgi:GNAT superfamily N-acetyltransferase